MENNDTQQNIEQGTSIPSDDLVRVQEDAESYALEELPELNPGEVQVPSSEQEKAVDAAMLRAEQSSVKPKIEHRILIIHDNDQDGYCAANILKQHKKQPTVAVGLVPFGHGRDIRAVVIDPDKWDEIFILDLVTPLSYLRDLLLNGFKVTVIDHHQTTISALEEFVDPNFCAFVGNTKAACGLTWQYCHGDVPMPWTVQMINNWDMWQHEDPQVIPFHYGMDCIDLSEDKIWRQLIKGDPQSCTQIMQMGQMVGSYWVNKMNDITTANAYLVVKDDYKFLCCNGNFNSSYDFAASFDVEKYDAMMWYVADKNGNWKVNMRTTKPAINLLEVAEKFGVNGHPQSCGCTMTTEQIKEWFPGDHDNHNAEQITPENN